MEISFHQFFNHIDNYAQPHFLYLTSKGIEATKRSRDKFEESEDERDGGGAEEG